MLTHYLKISIRNLWKNRLQTFICLVGLSVGMACFALSALWLNYIESFEDFVEDADRTYLLSEGNSRFVQDMTDYYVRDAFVEKAKAIQEHCPEIEEIYIWTRDGIQTKEYERPIQYMKGPADLYEILNLDMLYGRGELLADNEIIISRKWAVENMGKEDVVGETIVKLDWRNNPSETFEIVGVFGDMPTNTALFEYYDCFGRWNGDQRGIYLVTLWAKLHKGADVDAVAQKAADTNVSITYFSNFIGREVTEEINLKFNFLPIRKLRVEYPNNVYSFSSNYVLLFSVIGLLVIFSALCNYFITMITQVRIRCRALAIRRMVGSSKWGIVWMNIVETILMFVLSALIGALIICFIKPLFVEYAQMEAIGTASFVVGLVCYCLLVLAVCLILTIVTTLYTLKVTQRTILYGHQSHRSSSSLDMVSNVVQISLSICVIFCVSVMAAQLKYLKESRDLGYERDNRMSILRCPPPVMDYIKSSPLVVDTVVSSQILLPMDMFKVYRLCPDVKKDMFIEISGVDIVPKEMDFWKLKMKEGRFPEKGSDEVLVNETLAKMLERDSIVGSTIDIGTHWGVDSYTITGVLKNIYYSSVTAEPGPIMFEYGTQEGDGVGVSFKIAEGGKSKVVSDIEAIVEKEGLDNNSYARLSDSEDWFREVVFKEEMLLNVLLTIAGVSLIVALFGVFSLISMSLEQRRKEIALRKVHGATTRQILVSFLKRQTLTLGISSCIAFPIGYVLMQRWLSSYIQQTPIAWWFAPAIFVGMALVVYLTIVWRIKRAVVQNPAEVIKNE